MKNFLRPLSVLAAFVIFLSSCSKKDNSAAGTLVYNSNTYSLNYAGYIYSGNYGQIVLANTNPTTSTYSGTLSGVDISMNPSSVTEGTYTYLSNGDDNYDGTKNFFDATVFVNYKVANGVPTGEGTYLSGVTAGTITIVKSGSNYTVTYSLTFGDVTVTGKYTGAIPVTNNTD